MSRRIQTKSGYDFYEVASLLQKSLRRGDLTMAARATNELLPYYANYVWNRLMTVSAEDCSDLVTMEIVALYDAWDKVNERKKPKDKGRVFFAKAIVILAKANHGRDADELNILVSDRLPKAAFDKTVQSVESKLDIDNASFNIPNYVYDVHTLKGKRRGATKKQFLREESEALTNKTTIFDNLEDMIQSDNYVAPQGTLF